MNYRTTIALVIILALVIGISIVYTSNRSSGPPERVGTPREWFYQVDEDDITKVAVSYQGQATTFVTDAEGRWHFTVANGEPVNQDRWGGIPLLASGPQYRRVIAESAADLARFGLQAPPTIITVGLKGIGDVQIRLGDRTPDGASHYAQYLSPSALAASAPTAGAIYLVDSLWGNQFARLVTDPPRLVPTPAGGEKPA